MFLNDLNVSNKAKRKPYQRSESNKEPFTVNQDKLMFS